MNLEERLKQAIASRDRLSTEVSRLEARRDLAQKTLSDIEAEIRSKGLDPDQLDVTIAELERSFEDELARFESDLAALDAALSKYRGL